MIFGAFFLGYKPQNTYTYYYEACVTSGFPETEEQLAGLKITCDAEVYVESDSAAYLKVLKYINLLDTKILACPVFTVSVPKIDPNTLQK